MAGFVVIAASVAVFFAMCWAISNFQSPWFRAAEIGVPLALAALFYAAPQIFRAPKPATAAFVLFAVTAAVGAVRPFDLRLFRIMPGSREGQNVLAYSGAATIALALAFSAVTGIPTFM